MQDVQTYWSADWILCSCWVPFSPSPTLEYTYADWILCSYWAPLSSSTVDYIYAVLFFTSPVLPLEGSSATSCIRFTWRSLAKSSAKLCN